MNKDQEFYSIGEATRRNLGELGHKSQADFPKKIESPQWDHGRHTIDGKTVFVVEQNGNTSKLHLISFPEEVEEEQIRDIVEQRGLRGVTKDGWRKFLTTVPKEALSSADFDIALMFTGQLDDSEAEFPATIVYNPRTRKTEVVSNWTQRFWSSSTAFLFAEK